MSQTISNRFVGRLIGVLYLAASLLAVLFIVLPVEVSFDRSSMRLILVPTLLAGLFGCFAPWEKWPRKASLGLVVYAAFLIAGGAVVLDINVSIGFPFYVLIFVWVGIGHPLLTSCAMAPVMALALLFTFLFGTEVDIDQIVEGITTLIIGIGIGEILSYAVGLLTKTERRESDRSRDIAIVVDAIEELASQVSIDAVGSTVAWLSGELLGGKRAVLALLDADLEVANYYGWGFPDGQETTVEIPISVWESVRDGEVCVTSSADLESWSVIDGIHSVLWAPVCGLDLSFGWLAVGLPEEPSQVRPFRQAVGKVLATQGGVAFERIQSNLSLLDRAHIDELTGVGNRRHAMALLARIKPGDAVVMLDIDHFKEVNDSFGHQSGDELLKQLADYLAGSLRGRDTVARFGGDEFIIVLHEIGNKIDEVTLRLLQGWRALMPSASISIGVALHESGNTPQMTLTNADMALYRAKSGGRDQSVHAPINEMHLKMEPA